LTISRKRNCDPGCHSSIGNVASLKSCNDEKATATALGKFYGAASLGGSSNAGVIYQLTSSGAFMVLHHVNGTTDGYEPFGQLILATDGNLYGVTNSGGGSNCGTIFKVTTSGQFTVLHNFDGTHGCNPREQLTQRTDGLLYGDTVGGGAHGNGVFYSMNVGQNPPISAAPLCVGEATAGPQTVGIPKQLRRRLLERRPDQPIRHLVTSRSQT
jgi:uncharacterized repeat protein (TIGR03803 family)